jgi:hypothetical protein
MWLDRAILRAMLEAAFEEGNRRPLGDPNPYKDEQ